jgi:hypothetical protein
MFWVLAFASFQLLKEFFGLVPWTRYVAWGFIGVLVLAGIGFVPRAVRTIRDL